MLVVMIVSLVLFFIHILVLVIKAFGKNEVINQSVTMLGGRMIGESDSGFVPLLTPISESTDTIVKGVALPVASVTSAFAGLYVSICQMNTGQIFDVYLENQLVIGRTGGSAYIQLNDNKVSAKHCMLYRKGEQILIQDLNSTNHTYLNGCILESPMPVSSGDTITLGNSSLRIQYVYANTAGR